MRSSARTRSALLVPALALVLLTGSVGTAARAPRPPRPPDWAVDPEPGDIVPPLTPAARAAAVRRAAAGPQLYDLRVSSGRTPFDGDRQLFATITPNGDGLRDRAVVSFRLARPATVKLVVLAPSRHPKTFSTTTANFAAGPGRVVWAPPPSMPPRTYLLRLLVSAGHRRSLYGLHDHRLVQIAAAPVVRVQGVDASFGESSYAAGASARLRIATDARTLTLQLFQAGPEAQETDGYAMEGVPVGRPRELDWSRHRGRAAAITVDVGDWPSGVYFARLKASDGRVGYAPFLVRPRPATPHRIAIVMHTDTWQAYNHQDVDGDGWGDTWYAAGDIRRVGLARAFIRGGAPPHWRRYDLPFLHWLYRTGKTDVDFLADEDLERFPSAPALARRYDLLVFEGHEEYVTDRIYDLVAGYRNLGGNLMFLSATNFLWRVDRHGNTLTRIAKWRTLGRPESRLIGVQYAGNDEGKHRGGYVLTPLGRTSWEFVGVDQSLLPAWRTFGIEYDMTTSVSPRGTRVLARVNPHMRRGLRGEMTYYELGGAKVFAAGTLNFRRAACYFPPYTQVLENVWARLSQP